MRLKTKDMVLVSLFAALMTVGAYIKVLFPLVPFSLQPFFCAFAGIILGSRLGALSQALYVALGLAGVPVFTQGSGPLYVLKPTFGFLLGFILGAYVIGKVSESLRAVNFSNALISVLSGLAAIYLVGIPYLYIILKFYMGRSETTLMSALSIGFFPFILKDIALYVVVAIVAGAVIPVLSKAGLMGSGTRAE